MPRNSSGVYQLPAGNPVVSGTLVESVWANSTMSDIAQAVTDSLDRFGRSTMAAPLLINDGTVSAPGVAFGAESSTGLFRKSAKVLGVTAGGMEVATFTQAGVTFPKGIVGDITTTGKLTLGTDAVLSSPASGGGSWIVRHAQTTGGIRLQGVGNTDAWVDLDPTPTLGVAATDQALVRVFRNINTTGARNFSIFRGDGSTTVDHTFSAGSAGSVRATIAANGGRVLMGTTTDNTLDGLQVALSARVRNGGSGVGSNAAAFAGYDEFVIEGAGQIGMSFLTPAATSAGIAWGRPAALSQGFILYNHATDQMHLGSAAADNLILDAAYTRSTLPIYAPDGTAAAPAFAFTTQPTWGIFRVAAIGIGFTVAGVEAARIAAAGLQFSAGNSLVSHNDTTNYVGITSSASGADGTTRMILYDSAHASNPGRITICSKLLTFADTTSANVKGSWSGSTTQGELTINTTGLGTYSLANRALLRLDGTAGSVIGIDFNGTRCGYLVSHSTDLMLSSGSGMALLLAYNNTEVARVDTDSTFQYKGIEVGFRGLGGTTVGNYTLLTADRGRMVWNNVVSTTITVPTGFAQGDIFTVFNISGNNISITAGSGMAFRWGTGASVSTTATRTLAAWGCANIIIGPAGTQAIISGTGIS